MISVLEIPNLKVYRRKATMPMGKKDANRNGLVFLNTLNTQSSADIINGDILDSYGRYHNYYVPHRYKYKIGFTAVYETRSMDRDGVYDQIKGLAKVQTQNKLLSASNKNIYFDISYWNELFMKNSHKIQNYLVRAKDYVEMLAHVVNDQEHKDYEERIMAIDLDDWAKRLGNGKFMDVRAMNTPVMLMYYLLIKDFAYIKRLNVNIVFVSNEAKAMVRFDPKTATRDTHRQLFTELKRVKNIAGWNEGEDIEKAVIKAELISKTTSNVSQHFNFTGSASEDSEVEEKIVKAVEKEVEKEVDNKETSDKPLEDRISDKIEHDEELMAEIQRSISNRKTRETKLSKRDEQLRDEQNKLMVQGRTLSSILQFNNMETIEVNDVSSSVATTNPNVTKVKFANFDKAYNDKLLKKDTMSMITALNKAEIPVFIRKIDVEDTSDEMSFKETYTVQMEDANRVRHTVKFDMPIFVEDKFMYLNGNKKMINKQLFFKPIVKVGEDEVQVVSNYNKIFVRRYGQKLSPKVEKLRKALNSKPIGVTIKNGSNLAANAKYHTTIEYDELSKYYTLIKMGQTEIHFNQDTVNTLAKNLNIKVPEGKLLIGFKARKEPILIDHKTQLIDGTDLVDYIMSFAPNAMKEVYDTASTGKKFMYNRATIMARHVPLVLLLAYCEGLSNVLRKAEIKHYFTDKRPKLTDDEGMVKFEDGFLVYEKYPIENALLMNAFVDIPVADFKYEDMDKKETYIVLFDAMFSQRNIASAFDNFYDFMIDPITRDILQDLSLPTEFVDVLLYANKLLSDNAHKHENDMSQYRYRANELVNVYLYKALTDAYGDYRRTAYNNNPKKISVRKDAITREVLMAQTIEDYSILNPIVELEKQRVISPKGPFGMNLAEAYTLDKRSYDPTMIGNIAISTSPDSNVGVMRQLSAEPRVISARGYFEVMNDRIDEIKDVNLFSPAELLSPLGASRDDSSRTAMAVKQSKHIIPIENSAPVLISNGMEQTIQYQLSKDFVVTAKEDGVIKEVDEKSGIVVIQYKSGKNEAFDISPRMVKNGAGGFYLSNKLVLHYKEGQRIKKNDIIASDDKFFKQTLEGNKFNIGTLQKVAIMGGYFTYEDSTFITNKMSNDMASDIIMVKEITLGKNSNVEGLVKPGDKIRVGDDLLRFDTSFEDNSLNELLANIGAELQEEIKSLGKKPITSKYTGVIADVKVYTTVDPDELSPSLKKIVTGYWNEINRKKNVVNKYDKSNSPYKLDLMLTEPTKKIETADGKVKGNIVGEGVLIQVFIKYRDIMGVGDKLAFFTALKSIIATVVDEGYEPYSEYRPDEEVSSFISPTNLLARMTPSIILTMFGYKVLIELKHQLEEIYNS